MNDVTRIIYLSNSKNKSFISFVITMLSYRPSIGVCRATRRPDRKQIYKNGAHTIHFSCVLSTLIHRGGVLLYKNVRLVNIN